MKKLILLFSFVFLFFGLITKAQEATKFPIKELGNCADKEACKTFCDKKENMLVCISYAENNGLMSKEEATVTKKIIPDLLNNKTPGGCKNFKECNEFCNGKVDGMEECITFAKKNDLLSNDELKEAEKILTALKNGAKLPGGCKDKKSCESFCEDPQNIDSCLSFAEASGMMSPEELADAKKVVPLMKAGKMPGNCKNKKSCDEFCNDPANADICINFAIEAGFIDKSEAEIVKKVGSTGPGGCKGKKECENFCSQESNQETCFNFAAEKGLISPEELKNAKEGASKVIEGLNQLPGEAKTIVEGCLRSNLGEEKYNKLINNNSITDKSVGPIIQNCFESTMKDYAKNMIPQGVPQGMTSPQGMPSLPQGGSMPSLPQDVGPDQNGMGLSNGPMSQDIPEQYKNMIPQGIPQGMPQGIPDQYKNMMPPSMPEGMTP